MNAFIDTSATVLSDCPTHALEGEHGKRYERLHANTAVLNRAGLRNLLGASFALVLEMVQGLSWDEPSTEK